MVAEKSIEQVRKVFDDMMATTHKSMSDMEANSTVLQGKMRDMGRDSLRYAEETVAASLDRVEAMTRAKSPQELVEIQQKFVQTQMERLGSQARSFGDTAMKAAQDLTKAFEK